MPKKIAKLLKRLKKQRTLGKRARGIAAFDEKKPDPKVAQAKEAAKQLRPANNTTCDVYVGGATPPAAPSTAAVPCYLVPRFQLGQEASEGDLNYQWTHLMLVDKDKDVRDDYPAVPTTCRVYVPDKDGTGFNVVFVELVYRGLPGAHKKVYLDRRAPTFPTNEL